MSTVWAFDQIENQHTLYHGKDSMKNFCTSSREYAKNITDFEKRESVTATVTVTSRRKSMLYLHKNTFIKTL